jgi:hypothetical protein
MGFLLWELTKTRLDKTFGVEESSGIGKARILDEGEGVLDKDLAIETHATCDGDDSPPSLLHLFLTYRDGNRSFLKEWHVLSMKGGKVTENSPVNGFNLPCDKVFCVIAAFIRESDSCVGIEYLCRGWSQICTHHGGSTDNSEADSFNGCDRV